MIVQRAGEQIHLIGSTDQPLDWRRAHGLALVLQSHALECRRRQYLREGRCLSCGAHQGEQHKPDCEGPDQPPQDPTATTIREVA